LYVPSISELENYIHTWDVSYTLFII
jgi:hypothetical protein